MPVLRKGRVVGYRIAQIEAAEPAIRQVQMDLLAEPPLRPDAEGVTHDQHPDHQLGIDRGPPRGTVEWRQMPAHVAEIDEAIHRAQQ
jgi:hypothetical protein